jgi:hypothetical protein
MPVLCVNMLDGLVGNILTQAAEFVDQFVYGLYHSGFDVSLSDPHANRSRKPQKKKKKTLHAYTVWLGEVLTVCAKHSHQAGYRLAL